MLIFLRNAILLCAFLLPFTSKAQHSGLRTMTVAHADTIQLDTLSIYPNSFEINCGGNAFSSDKYELDYARSQIILLDKCEDSLSVSFRVLPFDLSAPIAVRDTSLIYEENKGLRERFMITW